MHYLLKRVNNIPRLLLHRYLQSSSDIPDIKSILMAATKRGLHVPETPRHLRLKRSRIEHGKSPRVSHQFSLACVSNGYGLSPRSVLLRLEHRSFLIGCGEATQRILSELPFKFVRISQILISRMDWAQIGGILGLSITLNGSGVDELTLNAPSNLKALVETIRDVESYNCLRFTEQSDAYVDDSLQIKKFIFPDSSVCFFVIESKLIPGKLSVEKCNILGVPPNQLRARLKNGESVTLDTGIVIEPSQVLDDPLPKIRLIVIDMPDMSDRNQKFLLESLDHIHCDDDKIQNYVLHFLPLDLYKSSSYLKLMECREYFKDAYHFILDEERKNIQSIGIHSLQQKLNAVDNEFFPNFPVTFAEINSNQTPIVIAIKNMEIEEAISFNVLNFKKENSNLDCPILIVNF